MASSSNSSPTPRQTWRLALVAMIAAACLALGAVPFLRPDRIAPPTDGAVATAALPRADLATIADHPPDRLTLYRAAHNPRVLVLDFPSLAAQAAAMNRIAALIEKREMPRDRVLSHDELRRAIADAGQSFETFYLGHDYEASALARFFNLAPAAGLSEAEHDLLRLLYRHAVLQSTADGFVPGASAQAVVSLAATGEGGDAEADLRRFVLRHELAHGEFFTRVFYRAQCDRFWREFMSAAERDAVRGFLGALDYDTGNETLMINEMQAYIGYAPASISSAGIGGLDAATFETLRGRFHRRVTAMPDF
ncbi:hypothetical protein L2U69_05945 [Zavarzinia compransoris]|uniref:hypothetical protein n=1 Tax=Zavarzinia marina TaxID=2911065 RepID=UPI001F2EE80A|nr:hypothetical protein [Zavarzinia marina]MCF4165178.1 hypothetical protein [Zavarzinia marina]